MALVTVQRSPSPSNTPESLSSDTGQDVLDSFPQPDLSPRSPNKSHSFSESYFAVKGAALILPQSECPRTVTKGSHGGDIQHHLQSMFYLLRQQDTIKVAVKLESLVPSRVRYMAVVSTMGRQDTEESVILGIDIVNQQSTIGMVLPVWSGTRIQLDVVAEEANVAIETQSKSDTPEGAEGVDCTYKKEDIPWSAGTVKNFTKDFEERIKESDSKSKKRSRSASSCSTSSSSLGSGDEGAQENVGSKTSAKEVSIDSSPLKNAQQQQGATQAVPAASGGSSANQEAPENPDEASSAAIRPTSIYDAEEIPLEPGIVRRTKQEIESRKVIDVPPEPSVQFGIDAKEERSGSITDRKSSEVNPSDIPAQEEEVKKEVVKTVSSQPKVSTESPKVSAESQKVSETKPQVSESVADARDAEEERQRRILHIGQETVEMPVGIVDKLHRDHPNW